MPVTDPEKKQIRYDESRERPYDVDRLLCNNRKAQKLLDWKPTINLDQGLKKLFQWSIKNRITFEAPFKRFYYKSSK